MISMAPSNYGIKTIYACTLGDIMLLKRNPEIEAFVCSNIRHLSQSLRQNNSGL